MKILQIVSQNVFPATDGGKLSVSGITINLAERGHKVYHLFYSDKVESESLKSVSENIIPIPIKHSTKNSYCKAILNFFSLTPYNFSKYKSSSIVKYLEKFFEKNDVDIIQIEQVHMGWLVDILRKLTSAPIVLRAQNFEMKIMERFYKEQSNLLLKSFAYIQFHKIRLYEPNLASKFNKYIMISPIDEKEFKEYDKGVNITNIPAGIDSKLFEFNKKDIIPYSIVHIGHLDWYPNYDSLNWFIGNIFPSLVESEPKYKLYVYGGGKKKINIPNTLKNNIVIMGYVDNLWSELENKALAVVPLRIGGGIRIKILEMLAFGINIISTNVGAEGIEVKNEKEIIIANSATEFKVKISKFFNNDFYSQQIIDKGKQFAYDNYRWEKVIEEFEVIYEELLSNQSK
jgi:glycosyltransferase involved in cell wall biosynthesis